MVGADDGGSALGGRDAAPALLAVATAGTAEPPADPAHPARMLTRSVPAAALWNRIVDRISPSPPCPKDLAVALSTNEWRDCPNGSVYPDGVTRGGRVRSGRWPLP
jgi:hypothetical protein